MSERSVAVFFGGRSVEHEVSVITAHEVMAAMPDSYRVIPVYIAKDGNWYCDPLLDDLSNFADVDALLSKLEPVMPAVDVLHRGALYRHGDFQRRGLLGKATSTVEEFTVAFPVIHGSHGEDGTLQGLFELADIPFTGCGVAAAALGMDKPLSRNLFRAAGLPVLDSVTAHRDDWVKSRTLSGHGKLGANLYVKPATLGSSIGVSRVTNEIELTDALELAFSYDQRAVIEPAQDDAIEINCSVLGMGSETRASVCEQPNNRGLLSYADKYAGGRKGGGTKSGTKKPGGAKGMAGSDRIIPAPISESLTTRIQDAARTAFETLGCAGVARVDFLVRPDDDWFVVNEINTLPGALSYYLWEPTGVTFADLIEMLIGQANTRATQKSSSTYSIDAWLLRSAAKGG